MNVFLPLPLPLTPRQWLYLAGAQCLIAGVVDGGANFGIAYAMYHSQEVVTMWVFSKNTIAGDLGVTPLIQCALSMIITSTLVHTDIHYSAIKPLPFVYPHTSHLPEPTTYLPLVRTSSPSEKTSDPSSLPDERHQRTFANFCKALVRFVFEGTENNMLLDWHGPKVFLKRLVWTVVQGLAIGVVFGLPLWCLAIVILGPIYGNGNMGNKWAPEVIKLVYGFILGILTNPLIAILALGSQAERNLVVVDQPTDIEKQQSQTGHRTNSASPGLGSSALPPSTPGSRRRPSIVANGSGMLAPQLPPGSSPILTRPRARTSASETVSIYSLGGTGGRAQRPRAASRASELSIAISSTAMPAESPGPTRAVPATWGSDSSVSPLPSTRGKAPGPASVQRLMSPGLEVPRESIEGRENDDVFGSKPLGSSV